MTSRGYLLSLTALLCLAGTSGVIAAPQQGKEPSSQGPRGPIEPSSVAVRILFGIGDEEPTHWSGSVRVEPGEVIAVEGWRFREGDIVTGPTAWRAISRLIRNLPERRRARNANGAARQTSTTSSGNEVTPNGVIVTLKAPDEAVLHVETEQGKFDVPLADLTGGKVQKYLDGRVEARLTAPSVVLVEGPLQEDFPVAVADGKGQDGAWLVYVVHEPRGPEVSQALTEAPEDFRSFVPEGGGDQVRLVHVDNGVAGEPIDVTGPGLDVWRPSLAVDGAGNVVVVWSEQKEGNWDIYRRSYNTKEGAWTGDPVRWTDNPGTDTDAVLASDPKLGVWMAYQSWVNGQAVIALDMVGETDTPGTGFGAFKANEPSPIRISLDAPGNAWAPAIAVGPDAAVRVAYDSYDRGNYDVMLHTMLLVGDGSSRTVRVASSPRYEARPSLAVDRQGRSWIAYEERDAEWGKDAENLVEGAGSSLYRSSEVRVRVVEGDRIREVPNPAANAPEAEQHVNSYPRIAFDAKGRPRLLFRHRQEVVWGNNAVMVVGGVWVEHATVLAESEWTTPLILTRSDGLLDSRPAMVPRADGTMLAIHNTDGRLRREVEFTPELRLKYYTHSGTPTGVSNFDLMVALLPEPDYTTSGEPAWGDVVIEAPPTSAVHPNEAADVARMRNYRIEEGGKTYRLLRGEFHRHSEISQDGGNDGSLEDLWRYAIDAGALDWIGDGDHDNGGGKEYTWWLVQKTTDLYHNPPAFTPMFCYERSVSYPGGHRNAMFPYRGVRTLPRLVNENRVLTDVNGKDLDANMFYAYLNQLGGICAAHTSGTGMGTDWRQNNRQAEPFVEIFQGHRDSYEHLGGPRVARRPGEAKGGWRPLGMVWNALALQYRLAFEASSDHISTHISYGVAMAEDASRQSIFEAFQKRHCYAATDNILLDVRSGPHLMGDEFNADGPVTLEILAHGTAPIQRLDIIKDFVYVYSTEPGQARVALSWTDDEKRPPGLSWYYVRVIQSDGQIAWGSPLWVHTGREAEGSE